LVALGRGRRKEGRERSIKTTGTTRPKEALACAGSLHSLSFSSFFLIPPTFLSAPERRSSPNRFATVSSHESFYVTGTMEGQGRI
jgi:hypothetical protein